MNRRNHPQATEIAESGKHPEFEHFLADLSAKFVALSPEQVNDEIQSALEECLNFFGIDRLALLRLLPDRKNFIVTHNADVSGISPYPADAILSTSIAPWGAKKLIDGEMFSFARPEELPPDADVDKQALEMFQIRSGTYFPIAALRSSEYSFGISSLDYNRDCPREHIPRLRLLGELIVNALERSKAELALRESEERLDLAASAAEAGLWIMDKSQGIVWATQKFRELFQFDPGEKLDFDRFLATVHSDDREEVRKHVRQSLEKRKALKIDYRIARPDGSLRWISSSGNMSPVGSGLPERLMGVSIDVTERRQMEIELRERLEEIEHLKLRLEKENLYLREEIKVDKGFEKIVGKSNAHDYVLFKIKQVAPTDATVLILGETGTGKGMAAHAIHEMSARKDRPMITVDCASLPANLIESELFGREKGAFTGAYAKQVGRFEAAHGGTIFLDEIGEMPLELQAKLLRALQEGQLERLGSPRTIKVDVRVIAATSRDLKAEVRNKRFREDLFYRINVFPISIPPLRMRRDDIPLLVRHFVDKYGRKMGRKYETIPKSTMEVLQGQLWPGNVRELEHVIERAVITSSGPVLRLADWPEIEALEAGEEPLKGLRAVEREHILRALEETHWKIDGKDGAASLLGLHPSTLRFRLKKLDIKRP
ncbi:MAG: Formate hydrogenlyase transcriptional activator [Syntrophorhabdus sp. PtaU1.Bin002]|nr:MAG: Formate hydrogenlyase transcriptional activator [Syntrophorhabdus sp. PtaU1.Bin002]